MTYFSKRDVGTQESTAITSIPNEQSMPLRLLQFDFEILPKCRASRLNLPADSLDHPLVADPVLTPALSVVVQVLKHRHRPVHSIRKLRINRLPRLKFLPKFHEFRTPAVLKQAENARDAGEF